MQQSAPAAAGRGADATVTLPPRFPNSMLLAAIQDEEARRLLSEEEGLRKQRNSIRDELRLAQEQKEKSLRELKPKADEFNRNLSTAVEALVAKKNALYEELDNLRAHQEAVSHIRDELRNQGFVLPTLNREVNEAEILLRDEQRELERLERLSDVGKTEAQRRRVEKRAATLQQKAAERKKVEAERQASKGSMERLTNGESPEERNKRFQDVRKEIEDVQSELGELRKKRVQRPESEVIDAFRVRQSALHEELTRLEARMAAIRTDCLPCHHFTYPPEAKPAIVGRGGATLRQLQIDFGVAICVDMLEAGHGFVVGGAEDVESCVAAIQELVAEAAAEDMETDAVAFPPAIKRQIIGARGATIESFERESGARLNVLDDSVEITGPAEAVRAAKAALTAFVDSLGTGEMPIDPAYMALVVGKAGSTISEVERESGLRSLRVDRARNRLVAVGKQEAIAKAFERYKQIVGGKIAIQATDSLIRAVIGPKGKTIRELEEATGARITCEGSTIQVMGSTEAVKAAKVRIEDLRRSEVRVPVEPRMFGFLTAAVVQVTPHEVSSPSGGGGGSSSSELRISPLEAVQRATGCDQVAPVRSEETVVIRGRPELAQRAATLVKQLMLRNPPCSLRVPYPEVLRGFLVRRQTGERNSTLLDQVSRNYSPLLHMEMDRDASALIITSNDAEEVREAAQEMSSLLKDITERRMRVIEDFPEHRLGQVIGPGGSRIREVQQATGTEIAVVRKKGHVQIFAADGNAEALEKAVAEIRRQMPREEVGEEQ